MPADGDEHVVLGDLELGVAAAGGARGSRARAARVACTPADAPGHGRRLPPVARGRVRARGGGCRRPRCRPGWAALVALVLVGLAGCSGRRWRRPDRPGRRLPWSCVRRPGCGPGRVALAAVALVALAVPLAVVLAVRCGRGAARRACGRGCAGLLRAVLRSARSVPPCRWRARPAPVGAAPGRGRARRPRPSPRVRPGRRLRSGATRRLRPARLRWPRAWRRLTGAPAGQPTAAAGDPPGHGMATRRATGLGRADRVDELGLLHAAGALDAQPTGDLLELGEQLAAQPARGTSGPTAGRTRGRPVGVVPVVSDTWVLPTSRPGGTARRP